VQNSKLLESLSGLNSGEWDAFSHFIRGPACHFNSKLPLFFDILEHNKDDKFHELIAGGANENSLVGQLGIKPSQLRYLVSDMWTAFLKFKISKSAEEEAVTKSYLAHRALTGNPGSKGYRSLMTDMMKKREQMGDSDFYLTRYLTESAHLEHVVSKSGRGEENNISEVVRSLDLFYLTKKLQLMCEQQNLHNILSTSSHGFLENEIIDSIANGVHNEEPAIQIYYRVYKTLTESETESHYYELEKLLGMHGTLFNDSELRDLYQYLMNYCIKKINIGESKWINQLFKTYKRLLESKIIFIEGKLSPWDFKNIVVVGLRSGEESWVSEFIESSSKFIASTERDNAYKYNLAYYYYYTGAHRKAISLISKVEFTDLYYQLDSRAILLKCYYEMGDIDGLLYFMPSFRMFLRRNKMVSDYQRKIYSNLVKYTNKLVRYDGNQKRLRALKDSVIQLKQTADHQWLIAKLEELIN
jgi:hypothetical protein